MKSQQAILQQILMMSTNKMKSKLKMDELKIFEEKIGNLPKKIKQLDATPYLFIFQSLIMYKDMVEFVLTQYQKLIQEKFLNPSNDKICQLLSQNFMSALPQHGFRIIQILMKIQQLNIKYLAVFFHIHTTIPMPENVLTNFRHVGFTWISRAFNFQLLPIPIFITHIAAKIFPQIKVPSQSQVHQKIQNYVAKILDGLVLKIATNLEGANQQTLQVCDRSGKFGHCFMCKKSADYYCKDTKIPVCGSQCKKQHSKILNQCYFLSYGYSQKARQEIQQLLLQYIDKKYSPALSVDFLSAIYLFSADYTPSFYLPHKSLLESPLIMERIWIIEAAYHFRKNQMFEHIFALGMQTKKDYVKGLGLEYFLNILSTDRFYEIYWNYDMQGVYRILPILYDSLQNDEQAAYVLTVQLIENIFNENQKNGELLIEDQQSNLIKLFNEDSGVCLRFYRDKYGSERGMGKFIIRNEVALDKNELCEIVQNDQDLCREFLKQICQCLMYAPIDQLLREIYYFVNIKISDKIYRMLQLLLEVYKPVPLTASFNNDRFFQLAYYLLILQTELHNPIVTNKKPTLEQMLHRVKSFDAELYNQKYLYLTQIYQRMAQEPFSQQYRTVSNFYRIVKKQDYPPNFDKSCILIHNWEIVYSVVSKRPTVGVLYRCCSILKNKPTLAQPFAELLINLDSQLSTWQDKQLMIQALFNIIDSQPNSIALWKNVFRFCHEFDHILGIKRLVLSSCNLTDSNFIIFSKDMMSSFTLAEEVESYVSMIDSNKHRFNLIAEYFLKLYQEEINFYVKLFTLETCPFLSQKFIEVLTLTDQYQGLFLNVVNSLVNYQISQLKWLALVKKAEQISNSDNIEFQLIFASFCREYGCPFYHDYVLKQTISLKTHLFLELQPSLLLQFDKFQPYFNHLHAETLKIFLKLQNLDAVIKNFRYFQYLKETYSLFNSKIQSQQLTTILQLFTHLNSEAKQIIYRIPQCIYFITNAFLKNNISKHLFIQILNHNAHFNQQDFSLIDIKQLGRFGLFAIQFLQNISCHIKSQLKSIETINWLIEEIIKMNNTCRKWNKQYQLRHTLMKKQQMTDLPGLLRQQKLSHNILLELYKQSLLINTQPEQILSQIRSLQIEVLIKVEQLFTIVGGNIQIKYQQQVIKEVGKQGIQWRIILCNMLQQILSIKGLINQLFTNELVSRLLALIQKGYLVWNYGKIGCQSQLGQRFIFILKSLIKIQ